MLDATITQGTYWGGAQIPYWIYLILVILPFTGFGLDHLALRSPITAILKMLSIIPLFGFWYFYDIAQACGEQELVEKYGIGIPFYGPAGIGAGIFSGTDGTNVASTTTPGPWLFMFYALTTLLFIAFPVNKFIIGDYTYGFIQLISLLLVLPAFAISFYDIYNLLCNTKGVFEDGPARFPIIPAMIIGEHYDNSILGPNTNHNSSGLIGKIVEVVAVEGTRKAIDSVIEPVKAVGAVVEGASVVATTAEGAAVATTKSVEAGAKAATGLVSFASTLPNALNKVVADLPDKLAKQKASLPQKGGFIQSSPSTVTIALLLSVGVMAFSGYVFYIYKNTFRTPEKSDDPPRNTRTVRESSKRKQ
jgi:hypothetical protein